MTIRGMRIACWIPKATNTHAHYGILIAFPLQKCLQERASLLRYTYTARLVNSRSHHPAPRVNIKIRPEYNNYSASCPCHWTTTKFNPSRRDFTLPPNPHLPQQRVGIASNTRVRITVIQFPFNLLYTSRITPHLVPPKLRLPRLKTNCLILTRI